MLESTFQKSVSPGQGPDGQLATAKHELLKHLPPILEVSLQLAAKAQPRFTAGSESDDTGLLSERDDVLRAVDLLMGRISASDILSISSPESLEASSIMPALSASEVELEKDSTIQDGYSPDQKPYGHSLLKHVPPVMETFQTLEAKASAYFSVVPNTEKQGTIDTVQGTDEKVGTDERALLNHLPPILEASFQLAAKTDVPFAALPSTNDQSTGSANEGPESQVVTDGRALLEHLPPILEASFQLAAKVEAISAAESSADNSGSAIANQGTNGQFKSDGRGLLEQLPPISEASFQLAAEVKMPAQVESSIDEQGLININQVFDQGTISKQSNQINGLLSERDDIRRAINSLMGRTDKSDQVSNIISEVHDQRPGGALLSQVLESSPQEAAEVDALLEAVDGTDRGTLCARAKRLQVEKLIAGLEARAVGQSTLRSGWLCQRSEVRMQCKDLFGSCDRIRVDFCLSYLHYVSVKLPLPTYVE